MTAVVDAGLEELHLVAMQSKVEKGVPCFWCWSAQEGLYEACLGMLNQRCIAIVFDLDETIIFASNEKKLETHMEEIKSDLKNSELDAVTQLVLQNQLCRVSKDNTFLKDFVHKGAITVDHEIVRNQHEKGMLYKPGGLQPVRPVIRVLKRNAVLTRLNPMDPRSSYFVNIRPGWDNLKTYLSKTSRWRKYKVYVCTKAARQYALEAWRLLDPEGSLISSEEISQRLVCVRPGSKKSLKRVFQRSSCHPNMAMVIDDRMNVWDDKDKRRVHNLPPYTPSVCPEDKVVNGCYVLQILRDYISEVHKGFFSEFDGMLLKKVDELMYENDGLDLVYTPDVGDYVELTNNKIVEHSDSPISPKNTKSAKGEVGARINGEVDTMDLHEVSILVAAKKIKIADTIDISSSSEGDGAAAKDHVVKLGEEGDGAAASDLHASAGAPVHLDDAAAARLSAKLTRRGPRIKGGQTFDKYCVFPNLVEMYPEQLEALKHQVRETRPAIPFYVCTIKGASTLRGKSKMYFTRKFTQKYILKNMNLPADDVEVSFKNGSSVQVRMIMGKGKNKGAMITTNWRVVVQDTNMKDNDIFVFWFRSNGRLKLLVRKLKK